MSVLTSRLRDDDNNNNGIQGHKLMFFYNLLAVPRTVSNTYAQVTRVKLCATHVQNRMQNAPSAYHVQDAVLRATWYEGTAHLLSLTEFKSHFLALFYRLNH